MMNGLYDMQKPDRHESTELLGMINLRPTQLGRYRDCYFSKDGERIIIFTRNGGNNRQNYQGVIDLLKKHPNYITDYDDDFDETYASIEFSIPEEHKARASELFEVANTETGPEVQARHLKELEEMPKDEYLKKYPKMQDFFNAMESMFNGDSKGTQSFGGVTVVRMDKND